MSLDTVLEEICAEREYQDGEWGMEFDNKNTLNDWVTYITIYMSQAARMDTSPEDQRKNMLKAATLAVAAIETFDRNGQFAPRHYEDRVLAGTRPGDEIGNSINLALDLAPEKDRILSVKEEIAIARMAVEQLLNGAETDEEFQRRVNPSLTTLLGLIDRLVRTAHKLEQKEAKSEKPKSSWSKVIPEVGSAH